MRRICIVFGGQSSEHEISLRSASCILRNIDRKKYEVVMLGITKSGSWYHYTGPIDLIESGEWVTSIYLEEALFSPLAKDKGLIVFSKKQTPSMKLRRKLLESDVDFRTNETDNYYTVSVDAVFPVLHGKNGEDGTIQGLFELAGVPYVGCGVAASANCMDKEITHAILTGAGVPKTTLVALQKNEMKDFDQIKPSIEQKCGYPMFVKPARAGSSFGISKVNSSDELYAAIEEAFKYDDKVVVEKMLIGREIECAVLGNKDPIASNALGEIIPTREFYDYAGKYLDDSTGLEAPAELDERIVEKVREIAVKAYKAMGCNGLSRVDFFVTPAGDPILNEINTLPGFTSISMFPRLFEIDGMSITKLIDKLIDCAFEGR